MTPQATEAFNRLAKFVFGDLENLATQARRKAPASARSVDDVWELREHLLSLSDATRFAAYEIDTMRFEDEIEKGLRQRYAPPANSSQKLSPASIEDIFNSL